jgi:enoyl reductase-like protein
MVFPVVMRAAPTVAIPTALPFFDGVAIGTSSSIATSFATTTNIELDLVATTGTLTQYRPLICYQGSGGVLTASSEL